MSPRNSITVAVTTIGRPSQFTANRRPARWTGAVGPAIDGSEIGSSAHRERFAVIDLAEGRRFERAPEWAPDQRLGRFERLLADLSAAFINVPSNQVDAGIRDAQQRIVEALDLDRCTLSDCRRP